MLYNTAIYLGFDGDFRRISTWKCKKRLVLTDMAALCGAGVELCGGPVAELFGVCGQWQM
jgi:hypothetical protein